MYIKPITLYVDEALYREFKEKARESNRSVADLIREAMTRYRVRWAGSTPGVLEIQPISLGKVKQLPGPDDDILEEMLG